MANCHALGGREGGCVCFFDLGKGKGKGEEWDERRRRIPRKKKPSQEKERTKASVPWVPRTNGLALRCIQSRRWGTAWEEGGRGGEVMDAPWLAAYCGRSGGWDRGIGGRRGRLFVVGYFRRLPPCSSGLLLWLPPRSQCRLQNPWILLTSLSMWTPSSLHVIRWKFKFNWKKGGVPDRTWTK